MLRNVGLSFVFFFFPQETIAPILSEYAHHTRDIPCFSIGVQLQMSELTVDRRSFFHRSLSLSRSLCLCQLFHCANNETHKYVYTRPYTWPFYFCSSLYHSTRTSLRFSFSLYRNRAYYNLSVNYQFPFAAFYHSLCVDVHIELVFFSSFFPQSDFSFERGMRMDQESSPVLILLFLSSAFLFSNAEKQRRERRRKRFFGLDIPKQQCSIPN